MSSSLQRIHVPKNFYKHERLNVDSDNPTLYRCLFNSITRFKKVRRTASREGFMRKKRAGSKRIDGRRKQFYYFSLEKNFLVFK